MIDPVAHHPLELLDNDCWHHILSRLEIKDLLVVSCVNHYFRVMGFYAIAPFPRYVEKFVQKNLADANFLTLVLDPPIQTRYDLTLTKVCSIGALALFPAVRNLKVLDAAVSQAHFTSMIATTVGLESLFCKVGLCSKGGESLLLPVSLKRCTLISDMQGMSDQAVRSLSKKCPNLEELILHSAKQLSIQAFSIGTPFQNLRKLELFSANFGDADISHVLSCCPSIRFFNINHCKNFTGSSLVDDAKVEFLEELNVCGTPITSNSYCLILERAKKLTALNISFCDDISEDAFEQVVYPPTLTRFIADWTNIGNLGFRLLLHSTHLEALEMRNCTRLTNEVFDEHPELLQRSNFYFDGTIAEDAFAADFAEE